jgi:hypothetical protein
VTTTTTRQLSRDFGAGTVVHRTLGDQFLSFFAFVLGGYAIGSKGFAYLGVPPVYVGEASLLFGLVALWYAHTVRQLLRSSVVRILLLFMLYGAIRTLPYLGTYGLEALRDGALWGYGLFSIIIASVILGRPERLTRLVVRYTRFVPIFLVAAPLVWITTILLETLSRWMGAGEPMWPGTAVPMIYAKAGDLLVHLGGAAAFMAVGLAGEVKKSQIALLALGVALTALSRGGLLAFSLAFAVALASRPRSRIGWSIAGLLGGAVLLLAVSDLHVRFPGNDREVSFQQLVEHVSSAAGSNGDQDLQNTKEWRLAWWATIVGYTIGGDYRWTGKGYGVNLATDDGFQVTDDDSLRSPHNATMTVLARSGVVGLGLWLALLGAWFVRLVRAMRVAKRCNDREWYALFTFLLAYWLALLVNGTFDVYLEGPAGGIWFWSVLGCGIAAEIVYRDRERTGAPAPAVTDLTPVRRS